MTTEQEQFWQSSFGDEYSSRNDMNVEALDQMYKERYGTPRSEMNREFLSGSSISSILEVGCNIGNQLLVLNNTGYKNLAGIEINSEAVERAQKRLPEADIRVGSALSIPFPDNAFDLVFTSGVLIHIHEKDLPQVIAEIHRVAKRSIWGFEYFSERRQEILYRGHYNRLWKADFAKLYQTLFPDLKLVKEKRYRYTTDENIDSMFLLEKK